MSVAVSRIGLLAQTACIWEATARKPGNVHRFHDFEDTNYLDYLLSAAAVAPVLDYAPQRRVGETVLAAVEARRQVVHANTNLGIVLLLAPLASVPVGEDLAGGLRRVLDNLDLADSRAVFQAIRLAAPGGLGRVSDQDVHEEPSLPLRQVMALAADRDLIACQYANDFRHVFDGVRALELGLQRTGSLEGAIIWCHVTLLASCRDSLILRKCGPEVALEASERAHAVLTAAPPLTTENKRYWQMLPFGWPHTAEGRQALAELDTWLRAEGHRRNPGTTADLVTACLFAALRQGIMTLPPSVPWSCG
jgi:triphosphoribosyl-dephospho-CoA synthase